MKGGAKRVYAPFYRYVAILLYFSLCADVIIKLCVHVLCV